MDVITVGEDGSYAFAFMPSDNGTYSIEVTNILGTGAVSDDVVVDEVDITVCNLEEVPGVQSDLYINLTNGQNIDTIDFELTFDNTVITVGEELVACEEFAISDVVVDGNTLTATLQSRLL